MEINFDRTQKINIPNRRPIVQKCLIASFFVSFCQLFTLWSWLPARITMYTPTLLYTTEEHGCSLTTFYVRVEQHEPTLLMIKTCNNEVSVFISAVFSVCFSILCSSNSNNLKRSLVRNCPIGHIECDEYF